MIFEELNLSREVLEGIKDTGFVTLTTVQEASLPLALAGKAWDNARHLVRPDGLHQWLVAEDPEPWVAASISVDEMILRTLGDHGLDRGFGGKLQFNEIH